MQLILQLISNSILFEDKSELNVSKIDGELSLFSFISVGNFSGVNDGSVICLMVKQFAPVIKYVCYDRLSENS
jgi:hypothetical protein